MRRPLLFVTDYGREDTYAAALHGAAMRMDPEIRCIDGTHGVPPGDVLAGAYHAKALAQAFPEGAVFCAVVDPGVGTARRAIAIEAGGIRCVAPDNGLVSLLWGEADPRARRAVQLAMPGGISATFHGRDVFAPAAAHLAGGVTLEECGSPIADPVILPAAFATRTGRELHGRIAVVDHFGNAISTIRTSDIGSATVAAVRWSGGETGLFVRTYDDIGSGLAALIGSAGHLEIAAQGRPAHALGGPAAHDDITVVLA